MGKFKLINCVLIILLFISCKALPLKNKRFKSYNLTSIEEQYQKKGGCSNEKLDYKNNTYLEKAVDQNFSTDNYDFTIGYILPAHRSFSNGELDLNIKTSTQPEIRGVGDFNNDGLDDLVIEYYETNIPLYILYSKGDGTFKHEAITDPNARRRHVRNIEIIDINNDGWLDIVGFTTGDPFSEYPNENKKFVDKNITRGQEDLLLINEKGKFFRNIQLPQVEHNDWNHGGSVGDINNDGFIDILTFREGQLAPTYPIINLDGKTFQLGKHQYSKEISHYVTSDADAGDVNNDGFIDIVVTMSQINLINRNPIDQNYLGSLRVILGDGDSDFSNNTIQKLGSHWLDHEEYLRSFDKFNTKQISIGSSIVELLDINKDGRLDIVEGYFTWLGKGMWNTTGFKTYINNGNCFIDATKQFFPNQRINRDLSLELGYPWGFSMADLDQDGDNDFIMQTDQNNRAWFGKNNHNAFPFIFMNNGDNIYVPVSQSNFGKVADAGNYSYVVGDFNGDKKPDLASLGSMKYFSSDYHDLDNIGVIVFTYSSKWKDNLKYDHDKFKGLYFADWYVHKINNSKIEYQSTDQVLLENGEIIFNKYGNGFPSEKLKNKLTGKYLNTGEIYIKGFINFFEKNNIHFTKLTGNIKNQYLDDLWSDQGDLIKLRLFRKDSDYFNNNHSNDNQYSGKYFLKWTFKNKFDKKIFFKESTTLVELNKGGINFHNLGAWIPSNFSSIQGNYSRNGDFRIQGYIRSNHFEVVENKIIRGNIRNKHVEIPFNDDLNLAIELIKYNKNNIDFILDKEIELKDRGLKNKKRGPLKEFDTVIQLYALHKDDIFEYPVFIGIKKDKSTINIILPTISIKSKDSWKIDKNKITLCDPKIIRKGAISFNINKNNSNNNTINCILNSLSYKEQNIFLNLYNIFYNNVEQIFNNSIDETNQEKEKKLIKKSLNNIKMKSIISIKRID
jgi:hypothetical protein